MDQRADLARIAAPTLVIGGAEDLAIPPEHQQALADAIPGARLELLSPGGAPRDGRATRARRRSCCIAHFGGGATLAAGFATRRAVLGDEHVDRAVAAHDRIHRAVPGVPHPLRVG